MPNTLWILLVSACGAVSTGRDVDGEESPQPISQTQDVAAVEESEAPSLLLQAQGDMDGNGVEEGLRFRNTLHQSGGVRIYPEACAGEAFCQADHLYHPMRQGDVLRLVFPIETAGDPVLHATGYYIPD